MCRSLAIVLLSGALSSAGFLFSDGRTEWILSVPIYRFFGSLILSVPGFLAAGVALYILLWVYLSAAHAVFLKAFNGETSIKGVFDTVAMGFIFPHSFLLPFGLFSNYYVHAVGIVLFGLLVPISLTPYLLRKATTADFYRRSLSTMLSLFVLLVLWTTLFEPLGVI